jgi:sulfonate transport system permease protein
MVLTRMKSDAGVPGKRRPGSALAIAVPLALLGMWLLLTEITGIFRPNQLPAPLQVLRTAGELLAGGELFRHIGSSALRVLLGFAFGASAALLVGAGVGVSHTLEHALDPTLQALRSIPSLAWVPFLLLWLGIDEAPKLTLIAIGAFFPVYVNLVSGIRQVDRKLVEVGQVFGLNVRQRVLKIVLPASLPFLLAGLRIGLGQGWLFLVAAELIASTRGLGFLLIDGQNSARPDIMLVSIVSLAILGKLSDGLLHSIEKRALSWTDGI